MKEKISEFVYSHREEMVDIIRQLVEIPSVKGKPEQSAPFVRLVPPNTYGLPTN